MTDFTILIAAIAAPLIILTMFALGASSNAMQIIGIIAEEIPIFGSWYSSITALDAITIKSLDSLRGLPDALHLAFSLLLNSVMTNLLDSLFLGMICTLIGYFVQPSNRFRRFLSFGVKIVVTIFGLVILWFLKKGSIQAYALKIGITNIAVLFLGIFILWRGFPHSWLPSSVFVIDVLINTLSANSILGFLSILALFISMFRLGFSFTGLLMMLAAMVMLALIFWLAEAARSIMDWDR